MIRFLSTIILVMATLSLGNSQTNQVQFGKNRVQYHHHFDEWQQYESENFITYWYGEGRNIGQAAAQLAEYDFLEIQKILEHRINDKMEIIVYTDITDLKQSNIGSEEAFLNTGGQTKIVENKIFVYFDGNHNHLRKQLREGITSVFMDAMLFGSNLQEIVQNAVMLNLPEWFKLGLIGYLGEPWNSNLDNQLKDIIVNNRYKNFSRFADAEPRLAGHAMWYFIGQNFGKTSVSNLLYLTRINRNMDSGFLYVLGSDFKIVSQNMMEFYQNRYNSDNANRKSLQQEPLLKNKRKLPITQLKMSPDGKYVAYVSNDIGRYRIWLQDVASGKRTLVMKGGFRNNFQATDYNYPLLAWNPNNQQLAIVYERRDVIKMKQYNIQNASFENMDFGPEYQRVYSIDYLNNTDLVLAGNVRGHGDIFIFRGKYRTSERVTNDFYDDIEAKVVNLENKKGILFISNRADTTLQSMKLDSILPINTFDVWYCGLEDSSRHLVRVTNTPFANERQLIAIDSTWFGYLSDESGIYNSAVGYLKDVMVDYKQYIYSRQNGLIIIPSDSLLAGIDTLQIDSTIQVPIYQKKSFVHQTSNYQRNIVGLHSAPLLQKQAILYVENNKTHLAIQPIKTDKGNEPALTKFQEWYSKTLPSQRPIDSTRLIVSDAVIAIDSSQVIDTSSQTKMVYWFQSVYEEDPIITSAPKKDALVPESDFNPTIINKPSTPVSDEPNVTSTGVHRFRQTRIIPSRLKFRADYVTTQLDNSLLFGGLESFAGTPQGFETPPLGILMKSNIKDLFEDYTFEGGMRIPTTFNGTEFFLTFNDRKHRWDKRYSIYRRSQRITINEAPTQLQRWRNNLFLLQSEFRYPFDIFRSLRLTATTRFDKLITLATDAVPLEQPNINEQRVGIKAEYVYDNSIDVGINMRNGTRYKAYLEMVKRINVSLGNGNDQFKLNKGFMTVLGYDARHYQRLDGKSILALRSAGATSLGSEKILYYLGGVDNWLFAKFNDNIPLPQSDNFAYQTIVTNMRGFQQNIRNGNSYVLFNSELRMPIFQYFVKRSIQSSFFRNFQLVGFFDMGTAWTGLTPFTRDNPLNTVTIENPPTVIVNVNYFRDPVVASYGIGARSLLFGYFVRLDYAWGIETRIVQKPIIHLSIGQDF